MELLEVLQILCLESLKMQNVRINPTGFPRVNVYFLFVAFLRHRPTERFTISQLHNPRIVIFKLHKIRNWPDYEALKLRNARSGSEDKKPRLIYFLHI